MMPKPKTCEQIAKTKTSILVIEKGNLVSNQISNSIKNAGLSSSTKLHKRSAKGKIKNHDIYVVNCDELNQEEQLRTFRKMSKSNPGATLFCVGGNFAKDGLEKESEKFTYPINIVEDSTAIVDHVSCVESMKKKLLSMWDKLEKAS
jgi:hypothetical protein